MYQNKVSLHSLILLAYFAIFSNSQSSVPGLFIDRVTLSSAGATSNYDNGSTSSTVLPNVTSNFSRNWPVALSQVRYCGLSVHNYKMQGPSQYFSFVVQMINVTTSNSGFSLTPYSSSPWILYLTFNALVITIQSTSLELITYYGVFAYLNNSSRTGSSQPTYYAGSSKFTFTGQSQLLVFSMLQWIRFNNISVTTQYFSFSVSPHFFSSLLAINVLSYNNYSNSLNSFKINILVIDCSTFITNLAFFKATYNLGDTFATNFNAPSIYGHSITDMNCFYTIFYINRYINDITYFNFHISTLDITGIYSSSLANLAMSLLTYCVVSCPAYTFVDYTQNTSVCLSCSTYITNCLSCSSKSVCVQCKPTTALLNQKCVLCPLLIQFCSSCLSASQCVTCFSGILVTGGCTTVVGCIQVVQVTSPSLNAVCFACNETLFSYNLTDKKCYCKVGLLVGSYCTSISGCLSTKMVSGTVLCISCSLSLHFQLQNNTCVCISGFQLINGSCNQICGDGRVYISECDDGNLIDGDGCSHDCKNEYLYKCSKLTTAPSLCEYYGLDINITLTSIKKVDGQNQAVFTFAFNPILLNLAQLNLTQYFFLTLQNSTYVVQGWNYTKGQASVTVNFSSNIEGKKAKVNFTFDQVYVYHTPIQLDFVVQANGSKLFFYDMSLFDQIFAMVLLGFGVVGLFMVVFCSWLHKMVGVQYLFLLQIIYYCHFGIVNYKSSLVIFQYLGVVGLNYRSSSFSSINFQINSSFQVIDFSSAVADVSLAIVASLITILFVCLVILKCLSRKALKGLKLLKRVLRQNLIFTQIISPITLSYMFPIFFIIWAFAFNQIQQTTLFKNVLRTTFFLYLGCLYFVNANLVLQRLLLFPNLADSQSNLFVKQAKQSYLPMFQLTMILSVGLAWSWLKINFSYSLLVLIVVFGVMLVWQLLMRPYEHTLDNIGIDLNMAVALTFLIFVYLVNKSVIELNDQTLDVFSYCTLGCLLVCCLTSIIRFVSAWRRRGKAGGKQQNGNLQQIQKQMMGRLSKIKNYVKHNDKERQQIDDQKISGGKYSLKRTLIQRKQTIIEQPHHEEKLMSYNKPQKQEAAVEGDLQYLKLVQKYRKQFRQKRSHELANQIIQQQ